MRNDEGLSEMLGAFANSLQARDSKSCIGVDRLTDWADGSMPKAERASVLDHIATCSPCARAAAELAKTYAPVKALHQGWLGLRGPLLRATGALRRDRVLSHAYEEHLKHCRACELKAAPLSALRQFSTILLGSPHPALRAAAVAAFAFLLVFAPRLTAPSRWSDEGYQPPVSATTRPKGDGSASKSFQSLLNPDKQHLDEAIAFWELELSNDSNNRVALAALADIYQRKSDIAGTAKEKRSWAARSERATKRLADLLAAPDVTESTSP